MSTSQTTDPVIGRLIDDRYEVRSRIARGGMATVYLATDQRLERRVAIKIMHGHLSDDSAFTTRFVQEARSAARLADPHVVSVFDQGQDSDMAYLVMEYLPGITLRDLLRDHGRLTPHQVIDIMDAVTSGLAAAHRAGIVHRDVKPENILLADDGRIKIGDFGLARAASAHTATGQALLGTIAYLSPELVTRGIADARSDIYALGIMMYEMLTGEQPYKGEQPMQIAYQHANESVPRPSARNPAIPADFDDLVLWATERDPEERPRDARELLERLREIEKNLGYGTKAQPTTAIAGPRVTHDSVELTHVLTSPAVRTGPVDPEDPSTELSSRSSRRRARGWLVLFLVLILGAGAGVAGWWFGSGPGSQVQVPSLANSDPAVATQQLTELGLRVVPSSENSLSVANGLVIDTDPQPGARVNKDSTITLRVSAGPRPVSLSAIADLSLDEATSLLQSDNLVLGTTSYQFTDDVERDIVLEARLTSDGRDISGGGDTFEGESIDLVVSAGEVPSVLGESVARATRILADVQLSVATQVAEFHDEIATGNVISIAPKKAESGDAAPFVPGDAVTLIVSKGPKPIPVPDVTGDNVAAAKAELEGLGLAVEVTTGLPSPFWGIDGFVVVSTNPAPGEAVARGTVIKIAANY